MQIDFSESVLTLSGDVYFLRSNEELNSSTVQDTRFCNSAPPKGYNYDLLTLSHPKLLSKAYRDYLIAGTNVLKTNTFSANLIGQSDWLRNDPREQGGVKDEIWYQQLIEDGSLRELVSEVNHAAVKIIQNEIEQLSEPHKNTKHYVAGTLGPLSASLSLSGEPGHGRVSHEQVVEVYAHQAAALIDAGVDILFVDSVFDSLNGKAALVAINQVFKQKNTNIPIIVCAAIGFGNELMISGESILEFFQMIECYQPAVLGITETWIFENTLDTLHALSSLPIPIFYYPEVTVVVGNPDGFETPVEFCNRLRTSYEAGGYKLVGGCYGITPKHMTEITTMIKGAPTQSL